MNGYSSTLNNWKIVQDRAIYTYNSRLIGRVRVVPSRYTCVTSHSSGTQEPCIADSDAL